MATIANDTQFIGISPTIDLTGKKSAILNEQTIPVTMDDITSTVRPYNVFTALLTQSGGDNVAYISSDDTEPLVVGVTYKITFNNGGDFTNVGAPNNNVNTFFIATGTTPNSWGVVGDTEVSYNTGAPVATVLENTIGNVWFTYGDIGAYKVNSDGLLIVNKTFSINDQTRCYNQSDQVYNLAIGSSDDNTLNIFTINDGFSLQNNFLTNKMIEIRVYE